jgi:hypothetical protein
MTSIEKNRLIGVAFLVSGVFYLSTLILTIYGFSFTYPFLSSTPEITAAIKAADKAADRTAADDTAGFTAVIPNIGSPGAGPTPASKENKAQTEARRTMTMIYVITGVQIVVLLFVLFAGFTVVNVRARGRTFGIVASIFLIFFFPLGTVISILSISFLISDDCMELYAEVEKDKLSPQSII